MAFIGLAIPNIAIENLVTGTGIIGLTIKPSNIVAGNAVMLEVNQVVYNSNLNSDPISFNPVEPLEGTIYREDNNGGAPYLKRTTGGDAVMNDRFQFFSLSSTNFAYFSKDNLVLLSTISKNLIFSGAAYKPGLVAYANSGISGDYGTLKAEVDRTDMILNAGSQSGNKKIPAAILGNPCPPAWDPFN